MNRVEPRWIGYGLIDARLFAVVFTVRGENIRVISLRKANKREQRIYANG
ncbi:BrnT family toxin [Nitrincola sp.]